ncbi:MAG: M23 family metallopeptidase, partial [Actinomycetota bacterium]
VGLGVEVSHGGGVYSRYLHLNQALVSEGQSVSQGQIIAYSGNTGYLTTGAHLHFELYDFNNPNNYNGTVNPLDYLP